MYRPTIVFTIIRVSFHLEWICDSICWVLKGVNNNGEQEDSLCQVNVMYCFTLFTSTNQTFIFNKISQKTVEYP